MRHIELFENYNRIFKLGDEVYCIDNKYLPGNDSVTLEIGEKCIVIAKTEGSIKVKKTNGEMPGYLGKNRFVNKQDFEKWELDQDVKKYNI